MLQSDQVGAALHQHGDGASLPPRQSRLHQLRHASSFSCRLTRREQMDRHCRPVARAARGLGRHVGGSTPAHIVLGRHTLGKAGVDPGHQPGVAAEVAMQGQGLKGHAANTARPHPQEQRHVRIAEAVDGLHGIPHQKQGAAILRLPARREGFQQMQLGVGRVLKLVHQDVLNAPIQRQQQITGGIRGTQGAPGGHGDFYEITGFSFLKNHP